MATNPPATPAKNDPRDDAFIREVDEEYRKDEMSKLASRYGRWVLLAIGVLLAALGGFLFWQAEQKKALEATSERFSQALDKLEAGDSAGAMPVLSEVAKGNSETYRGLATMTEAGVALRGGENDKAAGLLRAVADNAELAGPLRDVARMKLLRLEFDKLPPAEILKQLAPYLEGDNPWFPVAGEMAALAHMKAGAPDKAGPIFLRLAGDQRAPQSVRGRAEQMAAVLGQDVTKLAKTAPGAAEEMPAEAAAEAAAK